MNHAGTGLPCSSSYQTETAVVSGVANPTLNMCNTVKLENLIACINAVILTSLVFSKDLFVFNAAVFDIYISFCFVEVLSLC